MPRRISLLSLFLFVSAVCLAQKTRHFTFDYAFTVRVTDPGKPLEVWFPVAQSDQYQQVRVVSKTGDLPLEETRETEYGNRIFHASVAKADKPEYHFSVKYDVLRREHFMSASAPAHASKQRLQRFLDPDKLVPVTGLPAEIAARQVKPEMTEMEKG